MTSLIEQEFHDYDDGKLWAEIYKRVKNEASITTMDDSYSIFEARIPENRSKNRYRDVSPYDHSRVILKRTNEESDYINASFVEVPEAVRKYILTQGPLDHTCGDFWLMVWQQKSKAILMLNRVVEKGAPKCAQYWPLGSEAGYEDDVVFEDVGLRVILVGEQDCNNFYQRWFEIEEMATGDKREVLHFHYVTWPDFGVPSSPTAFLNFLTVVRESGALDPRVGPCVIHCSAGIGRSGTFCLVDSSLVLIEKYGTLSCIDVKKMLIQMRSYRMGLIQTPEQLRFSYLAIIQGGRQLLGQDANSNIKTSDTPPPPPARVTSLPGYVRVNHSSGEDDDVVDLDRELAELIDDDDEPPPELPSKSKWKTTNTDFPKAVLVESSEEEEEESTYLVRKRIREERIKGTQDRINRMKARQRKSELWKRRRSYLKPICIGLVLLVGSYMIYRFYW